MHGRLAIVDDAAKNAAIVTAIGSPWGYGSGLWLGCSDAQKEGNWLCDGKPMRFTSWAPGQPDNLLALDDCLEWLADSGQWNDLSCDIKLGYVCRGSASLRCPGAGRRISAGATSFCARGDELLDWEGAGKACKAAGGKLATIATAEEGRALFEALELPSGVPSWRPDEGVWIGLSDAAQEGTFVWTSGAGARFTSWAPGQPDDSGGGEDCATLTLGDGKWFDANCGKALPYLCSPQ